MSHFVSNRTRPEGKENQRPTRVRTTGTSSFRRRMLGLDEPPSTPTNRRYEEFKSEVFFSPSPIGISPMPRSSPLVTRNSSAGRTSLIVEKSSPMRQSSPYKLPTYTSFEELGASRSQPIIWKGRNTERDALVTRLISPPSSDGSEAGGTLRDATFLQSSPPQLTTENISELNAKERTRHSEISPPASPVLPRMRSKSLASNSSSDSSSPFNYNTEDVSNGEDLVRKPHRLKRETLDMYKSAPTRALERTKSHTTALASSGNRDASTSSHGSGGSAQSDPIEALRDLSKILAKTPKTSKLKPPQPQPELSPEAKAIMFSDHETFKAYLTKEGLYHDATPDEKRHIEERQAQLEREYQDLLNSRSKGEKVEDDFVLVANHPEKFPQTKSLEDVGNKEKLSSGNAADIKPVVDQTDQAIEVLPKNPAAAIQEAQKIPQPKTIHTNCLEEAVNAKLNLSLSHIKDAKRGMDHLDRVLSDLPDIPPTSPTFQECTHIAISLPRLWSRDPQKSLGITFTWLGFLLASFLAWYLAESVTCEIYCHPTSSTSYYWSPDDPFFPWAIPTKLDRWSGRVVSSMFWWVVRCVQAILPGMRGGGSLGSKVIYY